MSSRYLEGLRVTHVVCTDAFAGVERYVTTLAIAEANQGLDVTVVGGEPERMQSIMAGSGVRWLPAASPVEALVPVARSRADVIHAHMTAAEIAALAVSAVRRTPVVATRHFARRRGSSATARAAGRMVAAHIDAQIAISEHVASRIEGPSTVAHPGTSNVIAPPLEQRLPVVLVLQRLEREKSTAVAIRAWAESGLAESGWVMRVVGDGSCRRRLESLSESLGVSASCHFLGHQKNVGVHLRQASIFLATAHDEPYGLSVVEAMATALPVVASSAGGHLETVGALSDAALYPPLDATRAAALLRALAMCPDKERATYGERLQELQRRAFGVETHTQVVLGVYRRLVS